MITTSPITTSPRLESYFTGERHRLRVEAAEQLRRAITSAETVLPSQEIEHMLVMHLERIRRVSQ